MRIGSCAPAGMTAAEADATKIRIAQSANIAVSVRFILAFSEPSNVSLWLFLGNPDRNRQHPCGKDAVLSSYEGWSVETMKQHIPLGTKVIALDDYLAISLG